MEKIDRIKAHYGFTMEDTNNLLRLRPAMDANRDKFVEAFYGYLKNLEEAQRYLKDEETIKKHRDAVGQWMLNLFSGEYGREYFKELERVGMAHVKINLPAHYVNSAMHFVKRYLMDIVRREITEAREQAYSCGSLEKILDINLDVFTSSYIEEEKRTIFISHKVESYLIQFARRFSYGLNLILVLGLVGMGIMVMWLFVYDLTHIYQGDIEKGLLSTLGSLLMLWVVIELMDTEVQHLKGKKFAIKVFISVALVAVIRKILIISLSTEKVEAQLSLVAAVAVLGGVYWLVSKVE
ncbi:MAG: protoglobin domain-containing protein [Thermodesulfobacteriota bacterium]